MGWRGVGWGRVMMIQYTGFQWIPNTSFSPSSLFGICKLQTYLGSYVQTSILSGYISPLCHFSALLYQSASYPLSVFQKHIEKSHFCWIPVFSLLYFYLFNGILRDREELKLFGLPHWSRCLDTCQFLKYISFL